MLILDPHNEFAPALPEFSIRIDTTSLDLPFWLFRLEEFAEVLFRGRETVAEEVDLLRELIPLAKQAYRNPGGSAQLRRAGDLNALTADTPVPYRMADLLKQIDERMGLLESKHDRPVYRALRIRIEGAVADPRYRFMFHSRLIEDTDSRDSRQDLPCPAPGSPHHLFRDGGHAVGSRQLRLLGAGTPRFRSRAA